MTTSGTVVDWLSKRQPLAPFQRRFIRGAFRPGIDTAVLCGPRSLGKSSLSGELLACALDPSGPLHVPGADNVLLAGSLEQSRAVFRFLRARCPESHFRYTDSGQRISVKHTATNTRVRVASSDAKRAFGIVGARLVVGDEPAAWEVRGGALMYDALSTSGGKNEQLLILIGTKAPAPADGWWLRLVERGAADPGTYVQVHEAAVDDDGEVQDWSTWATAKRCNPLIGFNPHLEPKLRKELVKARRDDDAKRRYISYRLNRPTVDLNTHLVTVDAWQRMLARPVAPRDGAAVLGIDLGASRSWSAASLWWKNGRVEVFASCPGIPSLADQEKRDGLPSGILQELVNTGVMGIADGRHVASIDTLLDLLPDVAYEAVVADRFALMTLADALAARGFPDVEYVVNQWSVASTAIGAFRQAVLDGPMTLATQGRSLATLSVGDACVEPDTSGNVRMKKQHRRNRDDVAQSMVLAALIVARWRRAPVPTGRVWTLEEPTGDPATA